MRLRIGTCTRMAIRRITVIFSHITSDSSVSAVTRFLSVLITCGAASTHNNKRVAFKIKRR